ncbi:MAG: major facilitator superfamily [Planctomycetota bacterium]|nr:MAG: major facilitator superfamily [Planctomycetota bacterium]
MIRRASAVLAILFFINFLNYTDRFVLSAVLHLLKTDLHLTPEDEGWLATAFTLGYMFSSPIIANFADRWTRPRIVALCCLVWSLATLACGLAIGFKTLLFARVLIGVGEAGFLTVGPPLIADAFSKESRGKALSVFYTGVPIGCACGFVLGGLLPGLHLSETLAIGWRGTFFTVAIPGIAIAAVAWVLVDPPRGAQDTELGIHAPLPKQGTIWEQLALFRNRTFGFVTLALTGIAFATVPLLHWLPQFFGNVKHIAPSKANVMIGLTLILPGILGTLLGGWAGDRISKRGIPGGYLMVAAVGLVGGLVCLWVAILSPRPWIFLPALFFGVMFFMSCTPTLNTTIANISAPNARAMAYATVIFCMHAFGDTVSPLLFGKLIANHGLERAFLFMPVALLVSAAACIAGIFTIRGDLARTEERVTQLVRKTHVPRTR